MSVMLFKLSFSNIRKSMRDYAIYFFTLLIGVSIFYVFNAIGTQTAFLQVSENSSDIIDLLVNILTGISSFVAIVLGLLIVYASHFLMRRRNKEFALYLILGMGKRRISAILLLETLFIGIFSLGIGLLAGIGISQLMGAFVANLFEADMTSYRFTVSGEAILKTLQYFGIMYLAVILLNGIVISKCKLINLLQSGKKSEKLKLKNPVLCVIVFLLAACGLGYAYYQVGWNNVMINEGRIELMIALGAVSTFLIFWSVSGMLLRVMMSAKKTYYRGLNCFTIRQISSKVNTMVMSMTVICLMLFVTICALAAAFSMRNSMNANLKKYCPVDCEIVYQNEASPDYLDQLGDEKEDFTKLFSDHVQFNSYADKQFTFRTATDGMAEQILERYPYLSGMDYPEDIVKLSDYNALMKLYGKEPLSLNGDEFILLCDFKSLVKIRNEVLAQGKSISIFGKELKPKYTKCQDGFIDISAQCLNAGIYIVPDSVVDETAISRNYFFGNYAAETKSEKAAIEAEITKKYDAVNQNLIHQENKISISINTKIDISESAVGLGAIVTFLGLYIGIVFLISCGAVLSLKTLSEDVDSIPRYAILRKIGVEEKEISKSLFRQTGIFFLLPLLLASIHSIFGMKFALFILETFGTEKIAQSVLSTSVLILLIYGGYFLIAYFCGKSIIREHKS